jgi:glutamate synthase (NADPH/NADH) small chain
MGKPTGFLDYPRELPLARDPATRVHDWNEFHEHCDETMLKKQGARCMDCGVPFCHTGTLIEGMAAGCPINNLIPEWNDLVYRGLWQEALARLHKTNNFPEFTGRVCPAPCEGSCVLGISDPPVAIKTLECAIIDKGFEEGWVKPEPPPVRTGKKVAVIGSGPAGLACAAQLNKAGHLVTIYERSDRVGGLLMYGIPNMKLDKSLVVQRRVELLKAEGVRFRTSTEVGKTIPAQAVLDEHDAVVVATGSTVPKDFFAKTPGRELKGIHFAMEFLHANTKSLLDSQHSDGKCLSARDKDVIVIGGGDTGTDCVGTALRHGCRSILQLEIVPRPPDQRAANNPWPQWPKVYKLDYGQEEAKALYGADPRRYSVQTSRFVGDENGCLKELQTELVDWSIRNGNAPFTRVSGSEKTLPAQLVLLALGFSGPEQGLLEALGVEKVKDMHGFAAAAEYGTFRTSNPKVFAAGDARRGQSLVVWAINEGRGAAREVDRFLMGETQLP